MPQAVAPILTSRYPRTFGRFVLLALLGEGGMGRVYRAVLTGPGGFRKAVALKVLLPRGPEEEHAGIYASSIRNEARLGALLRHPGLVEVYDHGVCDGVPWISMELVEGVDLDEILRREAPLPPGAVIDLGLQICSALQYAHTFRDGERVVNLVHRDLKPANLLVDAFGRVKITDLGIASSELATVATTAHGLLKGTPTFIAPEQILGGPVDGRADLFAVGAILFEAATGRRLFRRGTAPESVAAVLAVDELLLLGDDMESADDALPGLGDVLRGCLWREPDVRFSSADVLAEALLELSGEAALLDGRQDSLGDLAQLTGMHQRWSTSRRPTAPDSEAASVPIEPVPPVSQARALDGPEGPELMSRTRIRAVGFEPPTLGERLPPLRARGLEGLLVAVLCLLVTASGPAESVPPPQAESTPVIPMLFVGPLLEDGGARETFEPPSHRPPTLAEHLPAPITVAPPPTPLPQVPGWAAVPAAVQAGHNRIVSRARVGTSRSFLVESPRQSLARVRLFTRTGDGPWQHEALDRVAEGYWGTVVSFDASMAGTLAYWFEVQPTEGPAYALGSAEAPWLVDVQE